MQTGRRSPTGWTAPPMWRMTTYTPFRTSPAPQFGAAHRPAGEAHARFPTGPSSPIQLSRLHRPNRDGETLELGGRPLPPRRDRERHSRPQVRRRSEPHAVRPLRRQRRLAGGTGDGRQPEPVDGRIGLDEQSATTKTLQATVLLPGRNVLTRARHAASPSHLPQRWPWETTVQSRPGNGCERFALPA